MSLTKLAESEETYVYEETKKIYLEVHKERLRQNEKWGIQNHPSIDPDKEGLDDACAVYEIPDELRAKLLCETANKNSKLTWAHIAVEELCESIDANGDVERRKELVQLAAVVFAWIERIDRGVKK